MGFTTTWGFKPAPWTPFCDQEVIDRVMKMDFRQNCGHIFENPDFSLECVSDPGCYFAIDLFERIRKSYLENRKLVLVLPSPETSVYMSVAENINKFHVNCRNVEVFFFDEYANGDGQVAPWQSPYAKSGQWMKYFYNRICPELRMPLSKVHFWTKENTCSYSAMIEDAGGADVIYSEMSWTGIRYIDAESFPAESMDAFMEKGCGLVKPMMEQVCLDSLRGMFGYSGDVGNVPSWNVTIGPKDLKSAKLNMNYNFLASSSGANAYQKSGLLIAMYGPVVLTNPGSMLRLLPGKCYVSSRVCDSFNFAKDDDELTGIIDSLIKAEEGMN